MSNVIPFDFSGHSVRVIERDDGELSFVAKDVTDILGYRDAVSGLRSVPDPHKGTHSVRTPGGTQEMLCVDEAGLYRLILRSNKPEAEPFMEWVTSEVLPSIRKTGGYQYPSTQKEVNSLTPVAKEFRAAKQLASLCGLTGNKVVLAANQVTERRTGVNVMNELGIKGLIAEVQQAELTATAIGEMVDVPGNGQGKAQYVNLAAWYLGLLDSHVDEKGRLHYRISRKGLDSGHLLYDDVQKDGGKRASIQQILYRESIAPLIRDACLTAEDFMTLKTERKSQHDGEKL